MPGVLCTPHLGASTEEAQTQVAVEGVGMLIDFLTTGAIRHAVNMTPLDAKTLAELRGYLDVAYRLGCCWRSAKPPRSNAARSQFRGEVASKNTKLLTASFAAGLLEHALEEEVNIVNAEMLLRERGIDLVEEASAAKWAPSPRWSLAEVETDSRRTSAAGTVFGTRCCGWCSSTISGWKPISTAC